MSDNVSEFDSKYLKAKRQARRKRNKQIQFIVFGILLFLIIVILLYMFTPLSKIKEVEISGNENVSKAEIEKAIHVTKHSRMYTYSTTKAEGKLKDNSFIKDAKVKKQLPNKLTVHVSENQVVGLIKKKNDYVPILENGKELKNYDANNASDGPVLDGFSKNKQADMIQQLKEIPSDIRGMISEISYQPEKNKQDQIKLFTDDHIQILGNIRTIADKMKYYPQMSQSLERDASGELKRSGYIDLSVGASFIPYSESDDTQSYSEQNLSEKSSKESKAKDELQTTLNKINKNKDKRN